MIGSQDNNSSIVRYYKTSKKLFNPVKYKSLPKQKQQKNPTQSMLIQQLQDKVIKGQQTDLVLQSSCQCTICANQKQPALQNYNYLATVSNSYLNLFTLLQHLTMIEPEQSPTILGDLLIPTILFKCSFQNNKNITLHKKLGHQNQSQNFIMFKSNSKNGNLEYPTYVSSYEKVLKILQTQQQQIRKRKHQQRYKNVFKTQQLKQVKITNNTNSSDLSNLTKFSKIVHKNNFNEQIPSFILPLLEKQQKYPIQRYIIHDQKTYMNYLNEYKMMLTQPLCIFRYWEKQSKWEFGKYQIFTIQTLSSFIKNKQVTSQNNQIKARNKTKIQQVNLNTHIRLYDHLNLIYIQSYTKTKPQQIKHIKKHEHSNIKQNNSLSIVHYSQFDQQIKLSKSSYMFKIVKLEIQIKLGKANKTSQFYMDSFQLEETLIKLLLAQQKISNRKVELNVQYKTYKIIHVLEQVCRIKVKKLKLKWLLNDHDEIVLQQCLVYQINRLKSLQPFKNKKDAHAAHILDYGNVFLTEKFQQEINYNHFQDLNQVIKYKMEQKAKCKTQPKAEYSIISEAQNQEIVYLKAKRKMNPNPLLKLNLNKTLPLKPIKTSIRRDDTLHYQRNDNHYSTLIEHIKFINKLTESQTLYLETEKRNTKQTNFNNIKPTYGGILRKSYKLRPYKTETNSPIKHQ